MKIGPMQLEHAVPGHPLVVEKYFIQRTVRGPVVAEGDYWVDGVLDVNINGIPTLERAREALDRTKGHYRKYTKLRIVKRTCTVETEVVA